MKQCRQACALAAAFAVLTLSRPAQATADIDAALEIADSVPVSASAPSRNWRFDTEVAAAWIERRDGSSYDRMQLALDAALTHRFSSTLNGVAAWRFDGLAPLADAAPTRSAGVVKEAYLSWQPTSDRVLDIGRVNLRLGAATGYNPTDFFKVAAIRLETSPEPESRRKNRMGSVMLRGQQLAAGGALSLQFSPRIDSLSHAQNPSMSLVPGQTNSVDRWLVTGSHKLNGNVSPQWLLYGERGRKPQVGLNLTALAGGAVVTYLEWAGGRSASQVSRAVGDEGEQAFHSRTAAGFTVTLPIDLSLTLEYQANGVGASGAQLRQLADTDPLALARLLRWAGTAQELPGRRALFARANWRNVGVRGLDISGFVQADTSDGGRQRFVEVRRRFDRIDISAQWQRQTGDPWTRFGASPERSSARLVLNFYY